MSFKDGIPLLKTLDEEDDADEDFSVEMATGPRSRWGRKHLFFGVAIALALCVLVAVVVAVAVPVALLHRKSGSQVGVVTTVQPSRPSSSSSSSSISPTPTPSPPPCESIEGCKSKLDTRSYQFKTLRNNSLRVLLISDPNSNISAASMDVEAGSFNDPPYAEGLAHFCEHMLFLGTEKYSNDHVYSNFLAEHGGGDNAFTSTQDTNYHFLVDSEYLEHALDMFAQFFIAPLFNASAVEREIHAVNSEHEKNLGNDAWREFQLLKHVSNPEHPFHQFATGTLSTLNSSRLDLTQLLHDYYTSSYSANTMQLVVYGQAPLATLGNWTDVYFSDIPNRHISPLSFNTTAFPSDFSGRIIYYSTMAHTKQLEIIWQTEPLETRYRNDVSEFLSRYLGHEGHGSILNFLKERGWANSLFAGSSESTDSFLLFSVTVELTEDGLRHISDVVATVFQYVRLLSSQSDTVYRLLWEDYITVNQVLFDYREPDDPFTYVKSLSQTMRLVSDPSDLLQNPGRLLLNTSLLRQTLSALTPSAAIIFIGTQDHNSLAPSDQPGEYVPWPLLDDTETIYNTSYAEISIPQSAVDYWGRSESARLWLPEKNGFVPTDFRVFPILGSSEVPQLVNLSGDPNLGQGVSLWWLRDRRFLTPHVNYYCSIESSSPQNSPEWIELTTLYTNLVQESLNPMLYPAAELSYSFSLSSTTRGLYLSVSGFSDTSVIERYLITILTQMRNVSGLAGLFDRVREARLQNLDNYGLTTNPYHYISAYLQQVIMDRPYWKHEQLRSEASSASFEDIVAHVEAMLSNACIICFGHGNIKQDEAYLYTQLVRRYLLPSLSPTQPHGAYESERVRLSEKGNYSVLLPPLNPNDVNSAVNVIFQIDRTCVGDSTCSPESLRVAAYLGLLSQIMADFCFYQLRTVEQLGYVVFCFRANYAGMGSFQVVVQSKDYSAPYVLQEIDRFFVDFGEQYLANLTENDWEIKKDLYGRALQQKEQTLSDEGDHFWSEIVTGREQFHYNEQVLKQATRITLEDFIGFYTSHITDPTTYRKMVIALYAIGTGNNFTSASFQHCTDYASINQTATAYPAANDGCN